MTLPSDKPPTAYRLHERLFQMGAVETHPSESAPLSAEDAAYAINSYLSSEAICAMATVNGKRVMKFRQWWEHIYGEKWVVPAYLLREKTVV